MAIAHENYELYRTLETEGKNKGYQFLFITRVPSFPVLELHITSQAEMHMHRHCTKQ